MKKYFSAILAVAVAIGAVAFTAEKPAVSKADDFTNYYYRFDGTSGQEGMTNKWTQITQGAYDSLSCFGSAKGCKITNTTNSSGHPTSVPLSGGVPTQTGVNVEVKNQP